MKLVLTFLLFLFCYLPGRCDVAPNSLFHFAGLPAQANDVRNQNVDGPAAIAGKLITAVMTTAGNPDLIYIEEEDQQSDSRKQVSRYVTFISRMCLSDRLTNPSDFVSIYRNLSNANSCRYITQRVLRI